MSIIKQNIHSDLKTALNLMGESLSGFARNLKKPNGETGISHTALIRVAQDHESTPWIREVIKKVIKESKSNFPEYWNKMESK